MMLDGPLPTTPEGNSVLVVMAHPDDAEFGCGGTIAKWAAAGKEINYVLCTSGDKGSSDPDTSPFRLAQTRRAEQINAAHALGARDVRFLAYEDGTLTNTPAASLLPSPGHYRTEQEAINYTQGMVQINVTSEQLGGLRRIPQSKQPIGFRLERTSPL